MKILVIDDDESFGKAMQMLLERRGHIVVLYGCGTGAIEYAETLKPDLTITDHNLGACDNGLKIASHLIGIGHKAILMSADGDVESSSRDMGVPFMNKFKIADRLKDIEDIALLDN